nr:unnamed protein product [Callosobruchus analis]
MFWHNHVVEKASQKLGLLFRCRKLYTPEQLLHKLVLLLQLHRLSPYARGSDRGRSINQEGHNEEKY